MFTSCCKDIPTMFILKSKNQKIQYDIIFPLLQTRNISNLSNIWEKENIIEKTTIQPVFSFPSRIYTEKNIAILNLIQR